MFHDRFSRTVLMNAKVSRLVFENVLSSCIFILAWKIGKNSLRMYWLIWLCGYICTLLLCLTFDNIQYDIVLCCSNTVLYVETGKIVDAKRDVKWWGYSWTKMGKCWLFSFVTFDVAVRCNTNECTFYCVDFEWIYFTF